MKAVLQIFYAPIMPFVTHPDRIALMAGALFIGSVVFYVMRRRIPWPLLAAGIGWLLFAGWEHYCTMQKYNIRIDLLVIWPGLLFVTVWGLLAPFLWPSRG